MKYLSRLTALLLAFVLLFSSSVGVIAESDISDLTRSGYDQMVSAAKEAAEAEAAAAAQEAASQPIINEGGVVYAQDIPEQTKRFDIYEVITDAQLSMGGETEITLPQSGKINLSAGTAAQWQIYIPGADMWVNIAGETGDTFALTYAVIGGMLSGGSAKVRALAGDSAAVANVSVAYGSALPPVEEEDTFVAEAAAASTFALRRSASTSDANAGIMLAETGEEKTPELKDYTIVINYVFEDNSIVADPYRATLAAGSDFSATVTFPTIQGYLPYYDNKQQNSLDLNITNIQADVEYTVTYQPTNVDYTIIHYLQNVDNDNYTIAKTESKQGLTNSTVPEVAESYEGFYALLYEKPVIAADGSTKVEIYYDRYYYLMNFNLDGGYGVEPIYARYGTPVGELATPVRAGYTFSGWSPAVPDEVPVNGGTYTALWTAGDSAKVTVVFWGENADDEGYSYVKSEEIYAKPETEISYDEDGFLTCGYHTHDADCYEFTCTMSEHAAHTDSCYTCGQVDHTHSKACYSGVGDVCSTGSIGKPNNPSEGQVYKGIVGTYIYIKGTWYDYSGSVNSGSVAPTICKKTEQTHTHTASCITCGMAIHTHSDYTGSCYTLTCDKEGHTHTNSCYTTVSGMDSELYKFVKADSVTVAADGSTVINVYYERVEYSVQFYTRGYNSTEYTSLRITDKWGASINDKWPTYNGSSSWYVNKNESYSDPWQNSIQQMPVGGAKFYGPKTGSSSSTASYYVEVLPGESGTVHNGVTYKLHHQDTSSSSGTVTDEERYAIYGFTYKEGTANGQSYNGAKFYYTRNSYNLVFSDGYDDVKTESVKYEAPLSTYKDFVPNVPSAYEPGSVEFGGWYQNPECTGEEYKLTEHTMPADNVLLYAKWTPVEHTVTFYLNQDAYDAETPLESHPAVKVPHGSKITSIPAAPSNGSYTFVGWFYMENGVEKAFDFANMTVNKDLDVYGKWSSNVLKQYVVYFKIQGTDTEIADPIEGSALAGATKTFDAKSGDELKAGYQEGYFPLVQSHSMTLEIDASKELVKGEEWTTLTDENGNPILNENGEQQIVQSYTFWYVQKDAVPYTVYYVAETLKDGEDATKYETIVRDGKTYYIIADTYTDTQNRKSVVTEKFKPVAGYMPDAYQKRLIIDGTDDAVNEIIFFYTVDTQHAYYKITHYTQNTDGESWTEYASKQYVGDINATYTANPLTIDGFTYDPKVDGTVVSGKLTADGLELKLYYTRNSYPYEVRYLEQGSGNELAAPKTGVKGLYGQVISESAIDITNYTAVAPTSQTLNIRIEESQTEAKLNIITFYYTENEATINYVVVGPTGCGTVAPTSETLKVLTDEAKGSTATASSNVYRFVGWYSDAACTEANLLSTAAKYVPTKADGEVWVDGTTYYAKFEMNISTLTISKTGMESNETAIFTVKATTEDKQEKTFIVTVPNDGSVTIANLIIGTDYTVTENTDWTWRYSSSVTSGDASGTIAANGSSVAFKNESTTDKWLSDEDSQKNNFGAVN